MQETLGLARKYLQLGFAIFPVKHKDKAPAVPRGFKDASKDPEQIEKWFSSIERNIGIATGPVSGVVVVDIDSDKLNSVSRALVDKLLDIDTLASQTGSGGYHFFFQVSPEDLRNRAGILPGIDFRADGGYVVAPPSIHPNGRSYHWLRETAPAPLPPWVLELVRPPSPSVTSSTPKPPTQGLETRGRLSRKTQEFLANGAPAGQWNTALFLAAKDHQEQGYSIEETIERLNAVTGVLDEADGKTIRSAFAREPKYEPRPLSKDGEEEAPDATAFLNQCGMVLKCWHNEFYEWVDNRYRRVPRGDMKARVVRWMGKATIKQVEEILFNLAALVHVSSTVNPQDWLSGSGPDVIATKNGLVTLNEPARLLQPSPDFFTLSAVPYEYSPAATCPTWEKILEEALPDPGARAVLQEWFGYNLTRESLFDGFALLEGVGANGKSVVTSVLQLMLGRDNVSNVSLVAFNAERTFPLAATVGKLANVVSDLQVPSTPQEGLLRQFISGEWMTIERKNQDPFSFKPTAKLTFATNEKPSFRDRTSGTWRRIVLFKFDTVIPPERREPKYRRDSFWIESGELAGVFNWALEGLYRLKAQGGKFSKPESMLKAEELYRLEQNPEIEFFEEYCTLTQSPPGPPSTPPLISRPDVYKAYQTWAEENGVAHPLGRNKFFQALERKFEGVEIRKVKTEKGKGPQLTAYVGLSVVGVEEIPQTGRLGKLGKVIE